MFNLIIKYILILPCVCLGQFYKYATVYGGMSLQSQINQTQTFEWINNELTETTPDIGDNYRYFVGIKKLSRFKWEKKPKFYYDGQEENASQYRSPVDKFEYLLQHEKIKQFGREYNNHTIWFRYVGKYTSTKIISTNNGFIDLNYKSFDLRFKYDLSGFRATLGGIVRQHPVYGLEPFKIDFPNYNDYQTVANLLGYVKEWYYIDENGNGYLDRLEQSFNRWSLDGNIVAQNTAQFLQYYATIPQRYNRKRLHELGNQRTLSGVVGLSYYINSDNHFILAYSNYFFVNSKLTKYGSDTNDYDAGIIANYKITKTLSLYTQIEYLNYFGRENKNINIGINYIIL
tara:strand:- start:908 stop:1939 length:1032 start_codon:yes stop_codon:yes gene_type:complete